MFSISAEPVNATMHPTLSNQRITFASSVAALTADVLLIILGTLGNLLVLMVILLNIRQATVSNLLLANLASIDFVCMAFVTPGTIYKHLCINMGFCHASEIFVLVHRGLSMLVVSAAVASLFTIAVDRFLAISYPFKYSSMMTKRRAFYCIFSTWMAGTFVSAIFMGLNFVYLQSAFCTILILITISLYIYIFVFALKKERQIAALRVTNVKGSTNFFHERKSTKTTAIILGVFIAAWIPAVVFYIVVKPENPRYLEIQSWVNTLYFLNASLNPFIYCVRSVNFRNRVKLLVKTSMIRFNL